MDMTNIIILLVLVSFALYYSIMFYNQMATSAGVGYMNVSSDKVDTLAGYMNTSVADMRRFVGVDSTNCSTSISNGTTTLQNAQCGVRASGSPTGTTDPLSIFLGFIMQLVLSIGNLLWMFITLPFNIIMTIGDMLQPVINKLGGEIGQAFSNLVMVAAAIVQFYVCIKILDYALGKARLSEG